MLVHKRAYFKTEVLGGKKRKKRDRRRANRESETNVGRYGNKQTNRTSIASFTKVDSSLQSPQVF